ncbi:hypothetical protein [Glaciecola sp. MF2-115]|uniref:hypothetical protein n=1 Tax=Glaciecola sp. MF2-115 TaxID=3384827 RepID=UPI0039A2E947
MKNTLTLGLIVLVSGCTSHLYSGTSSYEYNGKTCHSLVYWNDSSHPFDKEGKATTVVIKTPSGRSYSLSPNKDSNGDVSYELILPSGEFTDSVNQTNGDTELFCGLFKGKEAHQERNLQQTEFYLYCDKTAHPLRKSTDTMKASTTPYVFEMNEPVKTITWFKPEEIKADISVVKCD